MSNKKSNAAAFLSNMKLEEPKQDNVTRKPERDAQTGLSPSVAQRKKLKHVGGYLESSTVEKMAILRARLNKDNSQVLTEAINLLYNQQEARKAFND